jgi:chemotaxis signal transduction protein
MNMNTPTNMMRVVSAMRPNTLEVLAFTLGSEEYGIDIQKVQELRGYESVTRIANAPDLIDIDALMSSSDIGLPEKLAA